MTEPFTDARPGLTVLEDGFVAEPVLPSTIICPGLWDEDDFRREALPLIEEQGFAWLRTDLQTSGYAITFADEIEAVKFKLFYDGEVR